MTVKGAPLSFAPLGEDDARTILGWHYAPPYDFYDPGRDAEDAALLGDPAFRQDHIWAARDGKGHLIGFLELTPRDDVVEIGLGLAPEAAGQGLGVPFVTACLTFARSRGGRRFRLFVAAFNKRAITVYRRCGFEATGQEVRHLFGTDHPFIRMDLPES